MSADRNKITDEQLAAYLDGALTPDEMQALDSMMADDAQAQAAFELQKRIDESLCRQMAFESPTNEKVEAILSADLTAEATRDMERIERPSRGPMSTRRVALLAIAAVVAWIVVAWQFSKRERIEIAFQPRSLVAIYHETVEKGFEPYYECREPDRFAQTFLTRQGRALHLMDMPEDRYMLGLSYSGGLSRKTTAMLCRVDDQPVMVFVDRASNDRPETAMATDAELELSRDERDGLVFYEVTPVPTKRVTKYLSVDSEP